jgi:hypothetical protein
MDPIQKVIEEIESREDGASFSYRKAAEKWGCNRTTLARRHQQKQSNNATKSRRQRLLNPQQEHELVLYIERYTRRGLPPT